MPRSTSAMLDAANVSPAHTTGVLRYRYSKVERSRLRLVIADFFADGREDFADQTAGEMRWHPFTPTPVERQAVRVRMLEANNPHGWPLLTFDPTASAQ